MVHHHIFNMGAVAARHEVVAQEVEVDINRDHFLISSNNLGPIWDHHKIITERPIKDPI